MNVNRQLVTVAFITGLISACSSTPPTQPTAPISQPAPPPPRPAMPAVTAPVKSAETDAQKLDRMLRPLAKKSVYFDYDDYTIKTEYKDTVKAVANAMMSVPKATVMLEGNADERGSTEYNLALGQKRAEAVGNALRLMGVSKDRMEAISYGEEKPRTTCHEEKCWAENRRVDFTYKVK